MQRSNRILMITIFLLLASSMMIDSCFIAGGENEEILLTVEIIAPANGTEVNGTIRIDAKVIYCNCSGNTSVYIDKEFLNIGTRYDLMGQYEYFSHEWNTTTVENGQHEILVFDKHNIAYDIIYLFVNNAGGGGPIRNTRITSPGNNTNIQGLVTVHAEVLTCNCSGLTSLYVDGVFVSNGTHETTISHDGRWWEIFTHSWDSRTIDNGQHTLRVYGKHPEYFDEINVTVENEEEEQNTMIISLHNNTEVHGNLRVGIRVLACKCNALTSMYVDGRFISNGTRDGSVGQYEYFSHEWDSATVGNGGHRIRVYGKHPEYFDEITVFVNNTDDGSGDVEVRILSPDMNSEVSGIVTVRAEVTGENVSGNSSMFVDDVLISNGTLDLVAGQYQYFSHLWDSTTVENGIYLIKVFDKTGESFDVINVFVNNTIVINYPPILIVTPANKSQIEGIITIIVEVLVNKSISTTTLYIDDVLMSSGISESKINRNGTWFDIYLYEWNSKSASNGNHEIKVTSGDMSCMDHITVFVLNPVDESFKITTIISPPKGSLVDHELTIEVEVLVICNCNSTTIMFVDGIYISNGTMVDAFVRNGSRFEVYAHQWNTTSMEDGPHLLRILGKHRQYFDEITVIVDNSPMKKPEKDDVPSPFYGIYLIIIAVMIIVLIIIKIRKKDFQDMSGK